MRTQSLISIIAIALISAISANKLSAQEGNRAQIIELKVKAYEAYNAGEMDAATRQFARLLQLDPGNAIYRYYLGMILVEQNKRLDEAIKHLNAAKGGEKVNSNVHYYLGWAYHHRYRFEEAIPHYEKYIQIGDDENIDKKDVRRMVEQCLNGQELIQFATDLVILQKTPVDESKFYKYYTLSNERDGRLIPQPRNFLTPLDTANEFKPPFYIAREEDLRPGDYIYYSSYGNDPETDIDIFRIVRIDELTWGKPERMSSKINTPYDDAYPFLHPNGIDFYFASEGHSSMGGYDIFRCTYDPATETFSEPINMDFPTNSPYDDYLFIADANEELAYFTSARDSLPDEVMLYMMEIYENPMRREVYNYDEILQLAELNITLQQQFFTDEVVSPMLQHPPEEQLTTDALHDEEQQFANVNYEEEQVPDVRTVDVFQVLEDIRTGEYLAAGPIEVERKFGMIEISSKLTLDDIYNAAMQDAKMLRAEAAEKQRYANLAYIEADKVNQKANVKQEQADKLMQLDARQAYRFARDAYETGTDARMAFVMANRLQVAADNQLRDAERLEKFAENTVKNSIRTPKQIAELFNNTRKEFNKRTYNYLNPLYILKEKENKLNENKEALEVSFDKQYYLKEHIDRLQLEISIKKGLINKEPDPEEQMEKRQELGQLQMDLAGQNLEMEKVNRNSQKLKVETVKQNDEYKALKKVYDIITGSRLSASEIAARADELDKARLEREINEKDLKAEILMTENLTQSISSGDIYNVADKMLEIYPEEEAQTPGVAPRNNPSKLKVDDIAHVDNAFPEFDYEETFPEIPEEATQTKKNLIKEAQKDLDFLEKQLSETRRRGDFSLIRAELKAQQSEEYMEEAKKLSGTSRDKAEEMEEISGELSLEAIISIELGKTLNGLSQMQVDIVEDTRYFVAKMEENQDLLTAQEMKKNLNDQRLKIQEYQERFEEKQEEIEDVIDLLRSKSVELVESFRTTAAIYLQYAELEKQIWEVYDQLQNESDPVRQDELKYELNSLMAQFRDLQAEQQAGVERSRKLIVDIERLKLQVNALGNLMSDYRNNSLSTLELKDKAGSINQERLRRDISEMTSPAQFYMSRRLQPYAQLQDLEELTAFMLERYPKMAPEINGYLEAHSGQLPKLEERSKTPEYVLMYRRADEMEKKADSLMKQAQAMKKKMQGMDNEIEINKLDREIIGMEAESFAISKQVVKLRREAKDLENNYTQEKKTEKKKQKQMVEVEMPDLALAEEERIIQEVIITEMDIPEDEAEVIRETSEWTEEAILVMDEADEEFDQRDELIDQAQIAEDPEEKEELMEDAEDKAFIGLDKFVHAQELKEGKYDVKYESYSDRAQNLFTVHSFRERKDDYEQAKQYYEQARKDQAKANDIRREAYNMLFREKVNEWQLVEKFEQANALDEKAIANLENVFALYSPNLVNKYTQALGYDPAERKRREKAKKEAEMDLTLDILEDIPADQLTAAGDEYIYTSPDKDRAEKASELSQNKQGGQKEIEALDFDKMLTFIDPDYSAYSRRNPISLNPELPEGIVFKIQIGAFRQDVKPNAFKGLKPITAEQVEGSTVRKYTAGRFYSYEAADQALEMVQDMGYEDAFVVAYRDGQRVEVDRARRMIDVGEAITWRNYDMLRQAETSYIEEMESPGSIEQSDAFENAKNESNLHKINGLVYTVQIGIFSSPKTSADFANLSPLYYDYTYDEQYQYTTGLSKTYEEATAMKERVVANGIEDAFVTAYLNGRKINIERALEIEKQKQQENENAEQQSKSEEERAFIPTEEIRFRVQLGAYSEGIPEELLEIFEELSDELEEELKAVEGNKLTYYTMGGYADYKSASELREKIVDKGVRDAFVISLVGNEKIPVKDALQLMKR